ncbi:MAG: hypothetical protein QOD72_2245 [Acidimicrobiaceae bacterium]|jgi:hypothetical protein|nr:hypothetical protein [Acidimicrobiaceae bacterium]
MSTAQRLFIGYGVVILVVGFVLGTVLGGLRMKAPPIRALATAHMETLMQAAMHFGLAFAVGAAGFDSTAATWGAVLLVVGSAMQATGVTLNWITATGDQFAERSPGFVVNSLSSFVVWPGLVITCAGILTNL